MTASINWYINPIFYNDNTDKLHSNRTAKPIVRAKGDKNSLPRSGDSTKPVKTEKESENDNRDNHSYLAFVRTIITVTPTLCHGKEDL